MSARLAPASLSATSRATSASREDTPLALPDGSNFTVESGTLEGHNTVFFVRGSDPDRIATVMESLEVRFACVADNGTEYLPDELDELSYAGVELYTPNYVSPVYRTQYGPTMYLDTKDYGASPFGGTILRILRQALLQEDLLPVHVGVAQLSESNSLWRT